jgi:predicted dehydrogenase
MSDRTGTVRVGFVGLGGIATRIHIPILQTIEGIKIRAGAELNQAQAERTQQRFSIPKTYASYQEMYAREPLDAVYVCLPNVLHEQAVAEALRHGLHVYCEKPLGLDAERTLALAIEAEQAGRVLMPGYHLRFHPRFERARALLRERRLGKILQIQAFAAKPGPYMGWDPKSDWYFDKRNVGVLYDHGSHMLDLLLYMAEADLECLHAATRAALPGLTVPDNIAVVFQTPNGTIGTLNLAWGARANQIMFQFHGTAGGVIVTTDWFEHRTPRGGGIDRIATLVGNGKHTLGRAWERLVHRTSADSEYAAASRNFLAAVRGQEAPRVTARDAARVHRGLEGIARAIEARGTWEPRLVGDGA